MMDGKPRILIADDEQVALSNLSHILEKEGYEVVATQSGPRALHYLHEQEFDLVLTDLKMEKVDGMQLLESCRELQPGTEVIMITGYATVDSAISAMKAGAYHYIAKPYKLDEVRKVVREALEKNRLKKENLRLREHLKSFQGGTRLITDNLRMRQILTMATQVAVTDTNIVISGESGTGKELLARYIHSRSSRSREQMLSVNCGVFSEELLANELFGHEKGAFTGADAAKRGLVEMADHGTLFLDEITELSLAMQVKLLRVIQEKEVLPLGSTKPRKIDVRYITATNRNLQQEVKEGRFRQDLFFRINVVAIELPPLSERKDDIPLLALHFLKKYSTLMNKQVSAIAPEVMETLMLYDFPGNVRELENIVERGVALSQGESIDMAHLPDDLRGGIMQTFRKSDGKYPTLEELERTYIEWVLREKADNKTEAAKELGIDRVSLWRKLKRLGLG